MANKSSDENFARRIKSVDEFATSELFKRGVSQLRTKMERLGLTREDAEEVACDAFIKAWQQISNDDSSEAKFRALVDSIARKEATDILRGDSEKRQALVSLEKLYNSAPDADSLADLRLKLQGHIAQLSQTQQQVVELILGGESEEEITNRLHLTKSAVRLRRRRAVEKLRRLLELESVPGEIEPLNRTLAVCVDPGRATEEMITELYIALAAAYRSCGGSGLRIVKEERRSFVAETV